MNTLQHYLIDHYNSYINMFVQFAGNKDTVREVLSMVYINLGAIDKDILHPGSFIYVMIRHTIMNVFRSDRYYYNFRIGYSCINDPVSEHRAIDKWLSKQPPKRAMILTEFLKDNTLTEISRDNNLDYNTVKAHYNIAINDARKQWGV